MASIICLACVCVCGVIMSYSIEYTCPYCSCTVKGDIVINVDKSIEQHNINCLKKYDQKLTDYVNKTKGQDKVKESCNLHCEIYNKKWWVRLAVWNKRKVIFENNQIKIVDKYNEKTVHLQKHYLQWFLSSPATYISRSYKYILCPVCDGKKWVKNNDK